MRQFLTLLIKYISCVIAFAIGLDLFFNATYVDIITFSLVVTIVSFIIGDRIILPAFGNASATMVDFIITYVTVWIFGAVLLNNVMQLAWGSALSAIIVSFAEAFVHRYLIADSPELRKERHRTMHNPRFAFSTEFAEENESFDKKDKKD